MKNILCLFLALALPVIGQRYIKTVPTVADLVALNPNDIHNVAAIKWVTAEGTADEGSIFYYSASSVLATNTTTIFKPTGYAGRWIRGNAPSATGTGDVLFTDYNTNYFRTNATPGGKIGVQLGKTTPSWINVKDPPYSAVGDGSTDDTTAIQSALAVAQTNTRPPILYFPSGLYRITATLNVTNSNIQVLGDGMANSTIRVTATGIGQAFAVSNSAARLFNIHFSGLRIEGTNGLASPPDGIRFANVSESSVSDCYGANLNNGVVWDACEIGYVTHSTFSGIKSNGVYNTIVNASGFASGNTWIANSLFYQNSNSCWLIDGPMAKGGIVNSWLESTPNAILLENRNTTDVEIDMPTIFNNNHQNVTGSGFEGGRFVLARANGVTNYFITQGLDISGNKSTSTGASNAVEFIKGSNTNTSTAFFNTRAVNNMFAGVSVSAIYSDNDVRVHTSDNWIQAGLPETSGSVVPRWFSPPLISMQDTNRVEQTFVTRTAGNDINLWSFSTNSSMGFFVFDTGKSFYWDIGNNGNDVAISAGLLSVTGGIDITGQINSGSENRNITTAAGRVDITQFTTNGATVGRVPMFTNNTVEWLDPPSASGAGTVTSVDVTSSPDFVSAGGPITTSGTITLTPTNMVRLNGTNTFAGTNTFSVIPIVPNDSFALGTKTTGNYAAGDAEAGAALTGDSATAFFSAGTIEAARLGSGSGGATKFLREDSSWQTVAGSGDMTKSASNLVVGSVIYQMVAAQVTGTNVFIDSNTNMVFHNITTNFALVFTNMANNTGEKQIIITEDGTGGHPPAFETGVLFENSPSTTHAAIPSFPTNAGVSYSLTAYRRNGTNWIRGPSTVALSAATNSALFGTGTGLDPAFRALVGEDITGGTISTNRISGLGTAQLASNAGIVGGQLAAGSVSETKFAFTDITTSNATTAMHGLMPKLDGNTNHFFNGNGTQTLVSPNAILTNGASIGFVLTFTNSNYIPLALPAAGAGTVTSVSTSPQFSVTDPTTTPLIVLTNFTGVTNSPVVLQTNGTVNGLTLAGSTTNTVVGASKVWVNDSASVATGVSTIGSGNVMRTRTGIQRSIWIDAGAMVSSSTNGAATGSFTPTGAANLTSDIYAFDGATSESTQFKIAMPDEWDLGTIKARFYMTASAGTNASVWNLQAGAVSHDDLLGTALGSAQQVTNTFTLIGDTMITPATAAITVGGTPALNDLILFKVNRLPADAGDTDTSDMLLLGVKIFYTESATEPTAQ